MRSHHPHRSLCALALLAFFKGSPPARTTIAAADLALDARVEIECIDARPR
jgi:enamine deaminase RidA (YjgF/YER057c/UK114 family)